MNKRLDIAGVNRVIAVEVSQRDLAVGIPQLIRFGIEQSQQGRLDSQTVNGVFA